ncbi:hypothetical protein Tco_0083777 [Tanacetum coccineum]
MHTRASNSKLVKPLPEPERTLNRRLRLRNRRVPFNQRNNPHQNPRVVYPPILDINDFRHFLMILENLYPMDDEPMWAADHVVAPTPSFAITIPETANEFSIKGNIIKIFYHGLSEITQEVLNAAAGALQKTVAFANGGSSNSDADKIMTRMNAMTLKMDTQYKEL